MRVTSIQGPSPYDRHPPRRRHRGAHSGTRRSDRHLHAVGQPHHVAVRRGDRNEAAPDACPARGRHRPHGGRVWTSDRTARHRLGDRRPRPRQRRRARCSPRSARKPRWCCSPATRKPTRSAAAASRNCGRWRWRRPVTKAAWMATDTARVGMDVAKAIRLATSGRPGPVHLSLPSDILDARVEAEAVAWPAAADFAAPPLPLSDAAADAVPALLATARRPLVIGAPVLATRPGRDLLRRIEQALSHPRLPQRGTARLQRRQPRRLCRRGEAHRHGAAARQGARFHPEVRRGARSPPIAASSPSIRTARSSIGRRGRAAWRSAASPTPGRRARP